MEPKKKIGKKIFVALSLLVVAGIATFFIWTYIDYKHEKDPYKKFLLPRLELSDLKVTSLTANRTDMILKLLIENQMPIGFTADSLVYGIFINDVEIAKDRYKESIKIEPDGSNWISLPITVFNKTLKSILKENKPGMIDSVQYSLQASFYTDIVFKERFHVDVKKVLPLISIPELKVEHIKVDKLNFKRAEIELLVNIKNENVFPIKAKDVTYRFAIENNEWIDGVMPGLIDIKARGQTDIEIPIRISFKEVGKTLFDLLKKGERVDYKLHLTFKIASENSMIKDSEVILESSGTIESLLKAERNK